MEQGLHQIPLLEAAISQGDRSSEDWHVVKKKWRAIKSGRDCTGAKSVTKSITWPHKVIYGVGGQPVINKELTASSFIRGYLVVLKVSQDT